MHEYRYSARLYRNNLSVRDRVQWSEVHYGNPWDCNFSVLIIFTHAY